MRQNIMQKKDKRKEILLMRELPLDSRSAKMTAHVCDSGIGIFSGKDVNYDFFNILYYE
jgi:hypothetical protein